MAERRKDNKGRVLKKGESQRKNLSYQYRYTDRSGKRKIVYAKSLSELREKEDNIEKLKYQGLDYASGNITAIELAKRYIDLKQNIKDQTRYAYHSTLAILQKTWLGNMRICDIKQSDVKQWFVDLRAEGKAYETISGYRTVLKPAFQMAYDEFAIARNPFAFPLKDILRRNSVGRTALTKAQQKEWLDFIQNDNHYKKYYDVYVILLETGLRISELCGLVKQDLNFAARTVRVSRQLITRPDGSLAIDTPKTASGYREIPMTDVAQMSFKRILASRYNPRIEPIIDGVSGFVFLSISSKPFTNCSFDNITKRARDKFAKMHPGENIPIITPHVFRHTFCTNMANAGMYPRSLQYIMGHSSITITMNYYAHPDSEQAIQQMEKLPFRSATAKNDEDVLPA